MWRGAIISRSKKKITCEVKHFNKEWCKELLSKDASLVKHDGYYILGKNWLEYQFAKIRGLVKVYRKPKVNPIIWKGRQKLRQCKSSMNVESGNDLSENIGL